MRISEIETKTPEQLRIDALKKKKDKAAETLKTEKDRQTKIKARERMATAQAALVSISK